MLGALGSQPRTLYLPFCLSTLLYLDLFLVILESRSSDQVHVPSLLIALVPGRDRDKSVPHKLANLVFEPSPRGTPLICAYFSSAPLENATCIRVFYVKRPASAEASYWNMRTGPSAPSGSADLALTQSVPA